MLKIELCRIENSNDFAVPSEYDVEGVRIESIIIDDNTLSEDSYTLIGPRKVDITHRVPDEVPVYAEISGAE